MEMMLALLCCTATTRQFSPPATWGDPGADFSGDDWLPRVE